MFNLTNLKRKFKSKASRAYKRLDCVRIGYMRSSGNNSTNLGVFIDISNGGTLFRPAKDFLINRTGESVVVTIGEEEIAEMRGIIVSTSSKGYHVRFDNLIENEVVEQVAAEMDVEFSEQEKIA